MAYFPHKAHMKSTQVTVTQSVENILKQLVLDHENAGTATGLWEIECILPQNCDNKSNWKDEVETVNTQEGRLENL